MSKAKRYSVFILVAVVLVGTVVVMGWLLSREEYSSGEHTGNEPAAVEPQEDDRHDDDYIEELAAEPDIFIDDDDTDTEHAEMTTEPIYDEPMHDDDDDDLAITDHPQTPNEATMALLYYLQGITAEHLISIIVVHEDGSRRLCENIAAQLAALGLTENLRNNRYHAYAAIISGGQVVFEQLGSDITDIVTYSTAIDAIQISVQSVSSYNLAENPIDSRITINNVDYALSNRGLNIVTFDTSLGEVVDSVSFNTHNSALHFSRMNLERMRNTSFFIDYLQGITAENLVSVIVANIDASRHFSADLAAQFEAMGLSENLQGMHLHAYAAIISGGQVVFERIGNDVYDYITYATEIDSLQISLASRGVYSAAPDSLVSSIRINGIESSLIGRGLNIVVFDRELGQVVDSVRFDAHDNVGYRNDMAELAMTAFMVDYLQSITAENLVSTIIVDDDASRRFNNLLVEQFGAMGLEANLQNNFRYAYAAIIANGQVVFEQLGADAYDIVTHNFGINDLTIALASAGFYNRLENATLSSVMVNGEEASIAGRGINIVVFDTELGQVVDSVRFDTHRSITFHRKDVDGELLWTAMP